MGASNDDPSPTAPENEHLLDAGVQAINSLDRVKRAEEIHDLYDALRGRFPDDEFYEAWEPIIEPLLWALPKDRDPALLEHVDRLAPSSPLWSMVRRMLDYQESPDSGQGPA